MSFNMKHVISMMDFTREEIDQVLDRAESLEEYARGKKTDLLEGKILATLFFEPSTRTRLSFETAMKRLGGEVLSMGPTEASSVAKGETLSDTIRVVSQYCDAIALRHPKDGAARMASKYSNVPIINAGDGTGHHPTQTLLDLYTIRRESSLDDLSIALAGDLKYGRTVHSLAYALALYGARISLVSPNELQMPESIIRDLHVMECNTNETDSLNDVMGNVDVLYVTRIQKERFPDPAEYTKVAGSYCITSELLKNAQESMIVMHPLPRVGEIDPEVDHTPHAKYFQQAFYGVPVRMALLALLLEE